LTPHRVIRLEPGTIKNKSGREVVMTEGVYQLLSASIFGKTADDFVFPRPNGKQSGIFVLRGRMPAAMPCSEPAVP